MDDTAVIQADATSALSKYLHLLVCIPDDLDQRISRDAYALRRLETSGTDQLAPCHRRRVWTRQDQRRLRIQQGLVGGPWPRCRTERYIDQVSPRCKAWLREAITEAREDGTVAAVGSKLDAADKAVDAVLSGARDIAQDEVGMSTFSMACLALQEIVNGLIPWTKRSLENARPAAASRLVNREEEKMLWLAKAMLSVQGHPDWSDAEIAESVGKHKSTLSRNQVYQAAAAMARGNKEDRRHGHITVDPETDRLDIEAYAEDPEEPDWNE